MFKVPAVHDVPVCWSDVQKFPLRMKDNDLLVTELYRDPTEDAITALSVYLTPKTSTETLTLLLIQLLQGQFSPHSFTSVC